nr:uncharacterized protein CTRU02_13140 [Colletotrichum truncatum]KAF6783632.1 hypothetical protein CTRU02_13140 [Colletotrichum truncatum]
MVRFTESPTMTSPIKFDIPSAVRSFEPFPRLPPEIRQQIWEDAVLEPGMHFLRLDTDFPIIRWPAPAMMMNFLNDDDDGGDENAAPDFSKETIPTSLWDTTLQPKYATPKANISNYVTRNETLSKLSATCSEARAVVQRLTSQRGCLRLKNGTVVALGSSSDVVCLDYLHAYTFRRGCRLLVNIRCEELENIKRVAVPYCHQWEVQNPLFSCPSCGNRHHGSHRKTYPLHLCDFLTRHLPNLEAFYFIDYLILPKCERIESFDGDEPVATMSVDGSTPGSRDKTGKQFRPRKYKSNGRLFVEADQDNWNVKSKVFDTLSWIRKRFIQHATNSKLSKHTHPQDVDFGVLACEWVNDKDEIAKKSHSSATKMQHIGRRKSSSLKSDGHSYAVLAKPSEPADSPSSSRLPGSEENRATFVFGQDVDYSFSFRRSS